MGREILAPHGSYFRSTPDFQLLNESKIPPVEAQFPVSSTAANCSDHSIPSTAVASIGEVSMSELSFRLRAFSNFIACRTDRSAGFAPFRAALAQGLNW